MVSQKAVKKTALTILKNKWPGAITASLLFVFVIIILIFAVELITTATHLFIANLVLTFSVIFFVFPFFVGVIGYFRAIAFGEDVGVEYAFYPFSNYKRFIRTLSFSVLFSIRVFGKFILCYWPVILTGVLSQKTFYEKLNISMPLWTPDLSVLSPILGLAGTVFFIICILKYYFAPFLFVSNEELSAGEVLKTACVLSKGRKSDCFSMTLSLLGWGLLSLFAIPIVFTAPYFNMVYVTHCRFSVADYNKRASMPQTTVPYFKPNF